MNLKLDIDFRQKDPAFLARRRVSAPHDHRIDAGIATVAMVTVVTLAAISAAGEDICCDGVATQLSGRPIADANALTDIDIPACLKQARLNLKRMIAVLGVQPLIQAMRAA